MMHTVRFARAAIGVAAALSPAHAGPQAWKVESLGVPVKAVTYGNSHAVLAPGPGGQGTMFYTSYYCSTGAELIGCDFRGDRLIRQKLPARGGYAVTLGPDGAIYVGGVSPGDLYRYDLTAGKLTTMDVKRFGVDYIWSAAVAEDGIIYCAAGYPRTHLVDYDPRTAKARNLGELSPGQQYLRSICVDSRGRVWCGVGMKAHLIVYDPADGSKADVLPPELASNSCVYSLLSVGDYVLAGVVYDGVLLIYDTATRKVIRKLAAPVGEKSFMTVPGGSGRTAYLYTIPSYDVYRCDLETGSLSLLVRGLGEVHAVERNRWLHAVYDQSYVVYDLEAEKTVATKRLTEGGDGMDVFTLTAGPDGDIYGSTYINMHLFRCDAATGTLADLGKCSRWPGQVDSISLGWDGRIYLGAYTDAVVSVFDPKLPWRPGREAASNPREVGPVGKGQYRTRANCLGPNGRVFVGSIPSYNTAQVGAFTICDLKTGAMDCRTDFVKGGAVDALAADDAYVYGAGGGEFFVYDPRKDGKRFSDMRPCVSLVVLADGRVVGSGGGKLFVYNRGQNSITAEKPNPVGDFTHMTTGPDGVVYGVNGAHVARLGKEAVSVEVLVKAGGKFAAVDRQGSIYFARGPQLLRCVPVTATQPN